MEENVKYGIGAKAVRRDEFTDSIVSGWSGFKTAWSGQFTKVLIVSLFCLVLVAPAIACVIIAGNYINSIGATVAYGAFDGIGYITPSMIAGGGLDFAVALGNRLYHDYSLVQYALLIPLLAVGAFVGHLDYAIVWRYFSWTNQTLAMIVLWTASMYLFREKKNYWITAVPATFMSAVSMTYFFCAEECLGLSTKVAYPVGIILAAAFLGIFIHATKKPMKA